MEVHKKVMVNINEDGVFEVKLSSKEAIYDAHMQFIKSGGLFVATTRAYRLGDEIKIVLSILDQPQQFRVNGKVVWHTPIGAQGGLTPGIGVQLHGENATEILKIMMTSIADLMSADRQTETM